MIVYTACGDTMKNADYEKFNEAKKLLKSNKRDEAKLIFLSLLDTTAANQSKLELGKMAVTDKDYDLARTYFTELLSTKSSREYALNELGSLEKKCRNWDKALEYYEELEKTDSIMSVRATEEIRKLKVIKERVEKINELLIELEKEIDIEKINQLILDISELYILIRDYDSARIYLDKLKGTSKELEAKFCYGKLEIYAGNTKKAKEYLTSLFGTELEAKAKHRLGKTAFEDDKIIEAKKYYLDIVDSEYGEDAKFELGRIAIKEKNKKLAKEYFNEIKDTNPAAQIELGQIYMDEGKIDEARECFNAAKEYPNSELYAKLMLGKLEANYGDHDLARTLLLEVREYGGKDKLLATFILAKMEVVDGNVDLARTYFDELEKLKPNDIFTRLERGKLEVSVCNVNTARTYFDKIGKNPFAILEIGRLNVTVGLFDAGDEKFDYLIKHGTAEDRVYARLEKGKLAYKRKENDLARHYFGLVKEEGGVNRMRALIEEARVEASEDNVDLARSYLSECRRRSVIAIIYSIALELINGNYDYVKKLLKIYQNQISKFDYMQLSRCLAIYLNNGGKYSKLHYDKSVDCNINRYGSTYNSDIDIEPLFYNVLDTIETEIPRKKDIGASHYYLKCDGDIATVDGEKTSCIEVVSVVDKLNAINIRPVIWYGDTIDLKQKVKKLQ